MSEYQLGFISLFRNFKNDFCAYPFIFLFKKTKFAISNKPNDFFVRDYFYQFLFGIMSASSSTKDKLVIEFFCTTLNFFRIISRPPFANIGDGIKNFFRR